MIGVVDCESCLGEKKYAIISTVLRDVSVQLAVFFIFARSVRRLVMERILVKHSQSRSLQR